jgi:hypothetical protein
MMSGKSKKQDIMPGLGTLDARARQARVLADLSVYGGAAVAIAFDIRFATRNVDAVVSGSPDFLGRAARDVAEQESWPEAGSNDGVKCWTVKHEEMQLLRDFDALSATGGLRAHTHAPEYIFAKKCMAMRLDSPRDTADIKEIARRSPGAT